MVPRQSAEKIPMILSACDVAFISFANDELWTKTIPAKLQSYMACGMPILASAQGETERVIREAECGVCIPIGDEITLAKAIEKLSTSSVKEMSEKARRYFETHFEKQKLMDDMDKFLQ